MLFIQLVIDLKVPRRALGINTIIVCLEFSLHLSYSVYNKIIRQNIITLYRDFYFFFTNF